jgi:cytoskeletal protein CcmA (bactofilin family)
MKSGIDHELFWASVARTRVALQSSCHVESDVHHLSLAIEQGAHFHGHSRRAKSEAELR